MRITAKTDTSDLRGRLNQYALITGREVSDSVRQFARVACVELAHETQPFGNTKQAGDMGETAVARDIHKVYYPATGSKFLRQATRYVAGYNGVAPAIGGTGNIPVSVKQAITFMVQNASSTATASQDIKVVDVEGIERLEYFTSRADSATLMKTANGLLAGLRVFR